MFAYQQAKLGVAPLPAWAGCLGRLHFASIQNHLNDAGGVLLPLPFCCDSCSLLFSPELFVRSTALLVLATPWAHTLPHRMRRISRHHSQLVETECKRRALSLHLVAEAAGEMVDTVFVAWIW